MEGATDPQLTGGIAEKVQSKDTGAMKEKVHNDNSGGMKEGRDWLRDPPIRLLGYANEVGESFKHFIGKPLYRAR
jgi:hypothetical protein